MDTHTSCSSVIWNAETCIISTHTQLWVRTLQMAALGHIGDDGFFRNAKYGLAALALPLFLRITVRPRSSLLPSPVKSLNHVSSGSAITPTHPGQTTALWVPLIFCSQRHIDADFFSSRYIIVILSSIYVWFFSDLVQCKCVRWGGELFEVNAFLLSGRLVRIKLKWVGW